jgi:carboxyl-terminal processing protease
MLKKQTLSLLLITALLTLSNIKAHSQVFDKNLQKLQMAWHIISTFYVDSVNNEKLTEEAINGMLEKLDPHSAYISAKEVAAMNEPLNGSFEGIGVEFNILNDTLMVVNTIPGGPSEKVGIKAGDRIINIDDKNVAGVGLTSSDVFKMLRGPKNTQVKVSILRRPSSQPLEFIITRDQIPIFSIDASYMAAPGIAYIKVNRFAATTYDEFVAALKNLQKNQVDGLILDLRGNGGGYLNAAIDMADEFLANRQLIVYTQGLSTPRHDHFATARGLFEKQKLVILIDEGSASASEIVSGAIQDHDRGIIIGRRSYGKGLVQRPFSLPDGSMMRLTTAKYYTPSGRCIQKPYDKGNLDYQADLYNRYKHGEMTNKDSIKVDKSELFKTLYNQRPVYGGGGITPDVFVPADTTQFSHYYSELVSKGYMNRFVLNYLDKQRSNVNHTYHSFEKFKNEFMVEKSLMDELIAGATHEKIEFNDKQFQISEPLLKIQLKAMIARDIWGSSAYYEVINPIVNTYQKAIEILQSKSKYSSIIK